MIQHHVGGAEGVCLVRPVSSVKLLLVLVLLFGVLPIASAGAEVLDTTIRVVDGYGAPVTGASVTDAYPGDEGATILGVTDELGEITVPVETDPGYSLWASKSGYHTCGVETVANPEDPTAIEIMMLGQVTITGRAVDPFGQPIEGITVEQAYEDPERLNSVLTRAGEDSWTYGSTTTDAGGEFTLPAGAAPIRVFFRDEASRFESGFYEAATSSVSGPGIPLSPGAGATLGLGAVAFEPTAFFTGTVNWENPSAGSSMKAWKLDTVTSVWAPCLWYDGMWGGPYGRNWGLSPGTYRFSVGRYTAANNADGYIVEDVFATMSGAEVHDVNSASSYTLTAGQTATVNFLLVPPSGNGTPSRPLTPSSVTHSRSFTTYGYVVRHATGTSPVTLQFYRYQSGRWVLRKSTTARVSDLSTFSKYSRSTSVPSAGKWRVRARHKVGTKYRYSSYRYFAAK
jgi:hypothetical protein